MEETKNKKTLSLVFVGDVGDVDDDDLYCTTVLYQHST
jgi:hypothetical protein